MANNSGNVKKASYLAMGVRLADVRKDVLHMSQNEFAEVISKSVSTVGRYEAGECAIPMEVLIFLHDKYGVNLNYLICGDESPVTLNFDVEMKRMDNKRLSLYAKKFVDELDSRL